MSILDINNTMIQSNGKYLTFNSNFNLIKKSNFFKLDLTNTDENPVNIILSSTLYNSFKESVKKYPIVKRDIYVYDYNSQLLTVLKKDSYIFVHCTPSAQKCAIL